MATINYLRRPRRTRTPGNLTGQADVPAPVPAWVPTDIAGCKLWLDVSQITGLSNGDDISSMTDLSGNSNNLAQRTVSQNPHYTTNAINSLPVMRGTAAASSTWDVPWTYSSPCTFFYVGRKNSGTAGRILSGKNNNWLMGHWSSYENQYYAVGWVGANSDVAHTTNVHVWSAITSTTSYLWKNGTLVKSGTGGTTAPSGLTIGYNGTSEFTDHDVGEIIGYNVALSTTDRQTVENYLKDKWGVA